MSKFLQNTALIIFTVFIITGGVVFFDLNKNANAATEYISLSEVYVYGNTEWIEVSNASASPININGYRIKEGTNPLATVRAVNNSIIVPAGGTVVVEEADMASDFNFTDTGQTLILQSPDATEIEIITYGGATGLDANNATKSLQKILNVWSVEPTTKNIINKDITAPTITINSYETNWTNQDVIVTASVSDGTINTTTNIFTINDSFNFVAWDDAGNFSTSTVTINNIDKTAPTINILTPVNNVDANALTYDITGTASDEDASPISSIYLSLDNGSTWQLANGGNTWNITPGLSTSTIQIILVKATDQAGNIITTTGPIITYSPPPTINSSPKSEFAGESIDIAGTNFHSSITISIGGTSATITTVDSNNLTFTIPPLNAAVYDIVAQNPDGQSATLTNGLTITRECVITDVAHASNVSGEYPSCSALNCVSGYSVHNDGTCILAVTHNNSSNDSGGLDFSSPLTSNDIISAMKQQIIPQITVPTQVLGTKIIADVSDFITSEKKLLKTIDKKLTSRLSGNILLQVEGHGEAWYVDPLNKQRYYLANGSKAYKALRKFGLGITNTDLTKIPIGIENRFEDTDSDDDGLADKLEEGLGTDKTKSDSDGDGISDYNEIIKNNTNPSGSGKIYIDSNLTNRLKGKILLQVESRGEAWYLNPRDGKRYYMKDGDAAYQIMRFLSLGISNSDIRKVNIGEL